MKTRRMLAAVAEGPYHVVDANDSTVAIEKNYINAERLSRSGFVAAPTLQTPGEAHLVKRPMMD